MFEDLGYVYVLANSAMPGVVKIGKTTRSPSERSKELSGVTGLPTPFIVVYEQLFRNCSDAEGFVHTYLEQRGYRVTDNREFFNAPVSDVVRALSLAPGAVLESEGERADSPMDSISDDELDVEPSDALASFSLNAADESLGIPLSYAWFDLFEQAEAHEFGHDDTFRDHREAIRLYEQAAKLGSLGAYARIGLLYQRSLEMQQDHERALRFYKEGARKGNAYCYWRIGMLFHIRGDRSNAEKGFDLFVRNWRKVLPDMQHQFLLEWFQIDGDCVHLILEYQTSRIPLPESIKLIISERRFGIAVETRSFEKYFRENNRLSDAQRMASVLALVETHPA